MHIVLSVPLFFISVAVFHIEGAGSQEKGSEAPPGALLYFREDWKETPAEIPLSQSHVGNPDLIVEIFGPGADSLKKSHHDEIAGDPWYVWSGLCPGGWVLTLRKKDSMADLTSGSYIRWQTKQAGGRILRIVLGLENGTFIVSEQGTGVTEDWASSSISLDSLRWRELDIVNVHAGAPVPHPNLSGVHSIGCTDLMPGGGSSACSRLDWIEVYGRERQ